MKYVEDSVVSGSLGLNGFEFETEPVRLSFVKWVGGKQQLIPFISQHLPEKIDFYFEPFIGGGALFFYVLQKYKPKKAYISDVNFKLIKTYEVVRDNVEGLIENLEKHRINHLNDFEKFGDELALELNFLNNEKKKFEVGSDEFLEAERRLKDVRKEKREIDVQRYYYVQRDFFNDNLESLSDLEIATFFIYFNKSGFNGMYRESPKGRFNIPMGSAVDLSFDYDRLRECSRILNEANVEIKVASFDEISDLVCEDSFVYFDPPYDPLKKKESFTSYTKDGFSDDDQRDLANLFKELSLSNVKVLLSNNNTEFMNELYGEFEVLKVSANRSINADGTKRKSAVKEILVKNY